MPFLTTDEIHCHHIKPKKYGGNDSYENLVLINKLVHRLVHAGVEYGPRDGYFRDLRPREGYRGVYRLL